MRTILIIMCSVLLASCGISSGTFKIKQSSMSTHKYRFLALGDSYTIGESVSAAEGWPAQLVMLLRKEHLDVEDALVIAKTGWTTDELESAVDQWKPQGPFQLVTLLIGVNNQYRGRSESEYRAQFVRLLQQAIKYAGDRASHVVVLSIPDWGVTPFAKGRDAAKIAAEIDRFNVINLEEASRVGAHYVDVTPISRTAAQDSSLLASDGLHPSGAMYGEWARLTLPVAREILKHNR
jgi:lysophospholipase L1-like esterase